VAEESKAFPDAGWFVRRYENAEGTKFGAAFVGKLMTEREARAIAKLLNGLADE
jgi:hypothetical protein